MDIKHLGRRELGFILARMNAIDRADIDARRILRADARFGDDVRHESVLLFLFGCCC
jgi:hypothetical protein